MDKIKALGRRFWFVWLLLLFLPVYIVIAYTNHQIIDFLNNGFFTFWLSGNLQISGGHPYSPAEWLNGHHVNGATWIPNKIFPYPLPLALLTAPFGLVSLGNAYFAWDVIAQFLIAACVLWLASRMREYSQKMFVIILLVFITVNGNVYLGLMTGTFSALFLVFMTLSLLFLENKKPFMAGVMLAGLALKPPFLIIAALIGLWLLYKRDWKVVAGIITGGLGLLVIGLIQDPQWVGKFLGAGENLFNMRLGSQPTIISYTRLLCAGDMTCASITYGAAVIGLVGLFAWLTWKNRDRLSPIMIYSAAIALGVLLPPYIWSYDYALLVIAICYICFELIYRKSTIIYSTLFLLVLDIISFIGLYLFWKNPEINALTIQRDMWSVWVGLYVLVITWWLVFRPSSKNSRPVDIQ